MSEQNRYSVSVELCTLTPNCKDINVNKKNIKNRRNSKSTSGSRRKVGVSLTTKLSSDRSLVLQRKRRNFIQNDSRKKDLRNSHRKCAPGLVPMAKNTYQRSKLAPSSSLAPYISIKKIKYSDSSTSKVQEESQDFEGTVSRRKYFCKICSFAATRLCGLKRHFKTKKHLTKFVENIKMKFLTISVDNNERKKAEIVTRVKNVPKHTVRGSVEHGEDIISTNDDKIDETPIKKSYHRPRRRISKSPPEYLNKYRTDCVRKSLTIAMKENNGSEESHKEDLLNKKVDNFNKVKPVSVRYVASVESIVDIPVIQEESSTRSRYGRKRSKSVALMKKNFVSTALIDEEDDVDLECVTSRVSKEDAINSPINKKKAPRKESITRSRYVKKRSKSVALMRKKDEDVYNTPKKQKITVKSHKTMTDAKKSKVCKKGKLPEKFVLRKTNILPPKIDKTLKGTSSTKEILEKVIVNPKTIKHRQQNCEAMKEYNANHEDDLFDGKLKESLFKSSNCTLLCDTDSDNEQEVLINKARTPVTAHLRSKAIREEMLEQNKTPGEVTAVHSPKNARGTQFQRQAYIHRNIAEKKKVERREARKHTLKSALRSKSRAVMDDIVNESSRLISSLTKSKEGDEDQDNEAEDWF